MIEPETLKEGDHVWCFKISFNLGSLYGTLAVGLIAELEKTEKEDEFRVIQVKKGTSMKAGKTIKAGGWGSVSLAELFKDYDEGVQYWNSVVQNEIDRLTSNYEQAVKRVEGKKLKTKKDI